MGFFVDICPTLLKEISQLWKRSAANNSQSVVSLADISSSSKVLYVIRFHLLRYWTSLNFAFSPLAHFMARVHLLCSRTVTHAQAEPDLLAD